MDKSTHNKVLLIIKDGWGHRTDTEHNAVSAAHTPFYDRLMSQHSYSLADASGEAVGLPTQTQGNSEVGHTTIGAGRVLAQALLRIDQSIENGDFYDNQAFIKAVEHARAHNSTLHLMGLLQTEGVHSHIDHLYALLEICRSHNFSQVCIHVFLDGRDALPQAGRELLEQLQSHLGYLGFGSIATISGRYWSMDRNKDWPVTTKAVDTIAGGTSAVQFTDGLEFVDQQYSQDISDEFIEPACHVNYQGIADSDAVIFWNYRTDRARQLTQALLEPECPLYLPSRAHNLCFVAMTEYYDSITDHAQVAFAERPVTNTLSETVSRAGLSQLKITETVKFAHVTFFLNNGVEQAWPNENRILIRSPQQQSQADTPEMCAEEITKTTINEINAQSPDLIVLNYPNPDMVGHSGDFDATVRAVEFIDRKCQELTEHALLQGYQVLLTADHGNAEDMGGIWKNSHTINPVAVHILGNDLAADIPLRTHCGLCDIAPTILDLMNIEQPIEMTGQSIMK